MRILYVANHTPCDNQDEGAIAHSLTKLGHEVICVHEKPSQRTGVDLIRLKADFCLFHKWNDISLIKKIPFPRVSWNFDLVESDDYVVPNCRGADAIAIERVSALSFYTDGDWVNRDPRKRVFLTQGMDERVAGPGSPGFRIPILFTGSYLYSHKRRSHFQELSLHYGIRFVHLGVSTESRRHGRALADILASTKVVVALDGPSTNHYWSNRVFNTLGLGGFLIHPYCSQLRKMYAVDELAMYYNRANLIELIDYYLENEDERAELVRVGYEKTMAHHTYTHRCAELVRVVQERLFK